jgi:hypothetical protein
MFMYIQQTSILIKLKRTLLFQRRIKPIRYVGRIKYALDVIECHVQGACQLISRKRHMAPNEKNILEIVVGGQHLTFDSILIPVVSFSLIE